MFLQRAGQQNYFPGDVPVAPPEESTPPPSLEEENRSLKGKNQELSLFLEKTKADLEAFQSAHRSLTEGSQSQIIELKLDKADLEDQVLDLQNHLKST